MIFFIGKKCFVFFKCYSDNVGFDFMKDCNVFFMIFYIVDNFKFFVIDFYKIVYSNCFFCDINKF